VREEGDCEIERQRKRRGGEEFKYSMSGSMKGGGTRDRPGQGGDDILKHKETEEVGKQVCGPL